MSNENVAGRRSVTVGGFRYERPYNGSIEWRVYEVAGGIRLGTVRPNGSRIRERSWDWRAVDGTEGRAHSRAAAAGCLQRRSA